MRNLIVIILVSAAVVVGCHSGNKKNNPSKTDGNSLTLSSDCCEKGPVNQLTDAEKAQGWILMFNGTTGEGWRGYNKTGFPAAWVVEDGMLKCLAEADRNDSAHADGGDIVFSKQLFSNFDLRLEWKISEGGNSGIFYLGREVVGWPIYKSAPEMQILDNEKNPDSFRGYNGNRKAGSLYDLIPANPQNSHPAGSWNSVEIICLDGKVVHRQNGAKILEYDLWTPEWKELVRKSKFPGLNPDWENIAKEGVIGLQDHGNEVWFRNIKIRVL